MLGLSLIWLLDEGQEALAKRPFVTVEDDITTLVPLLVCGADMDFDCTALMVGQVVANGAVTWAQFGLSVSGGLEVGVQTRWMVGCKPASFAV